MVAKPRSRIFARTSLPGDVLLRLAAVAEAPDAWRCAATRLPTINADPR
jgi:hypothetical protein